MNWLKRLTTKISNKLVGILFFLFAITMIWFLFQLLEIFYGFSIMAWFKDLPYIYPITVHIFNEIEALTDRGIFYIYMFGGMFIFPAPNEILYIRLLRDGLSFDYVLPILYLGLFIAHHFNYFVGRTFGFILKHLFSKKSREKIGGYLKKYGMPTILIFNLIPFAPAQFFNFCCGLFKYKYHKWLFAAALGQVSNYLIITAIYFKFFA
ncbi:VTT domain-containing protein [Candidatus Woesearchaeota archaeon]|nr:VTT domain-containing protein [Candidatus Woesearchaeota archaeon]